MKRTLIALCMVMAATLAMAGPKPLTELTGSASYFKPADGHASWTLGGEVLIPLLKHGYLYVGPQVLIHNGAVDHQSAGAAGEFRLTEVNGPFARVSVLYDLDSKKDLKQHTVDAGAGFIFGVGKSGAIKLYAEKSVSGYGKSDDLRGIGALALRF